MVIGANAGRTAMTRTELSRPLQFALADGILTRERSFFDYGCGKGGDIDRLAREGFDASGWDPHHRPDAKATSADVVNLGYVVNVIEEPREREEALKRAWKLAKAVLVVAARPDWESSQIRGQRLGDGILTSVGTFQKFFEQEELRNWIQILLGVDPVAVAPGIFYVFKDQSEAAGVRARQFRNRVRREPRPRKADALWDSHRDLLEPLAIFWEERGRLPEVSELSQAEEIQKVVGSIRAAASVLMRVLGKARFDQARDLALVNVKVFLALEAFRGRPKLSELPPDVRLDVRAHFGNYKSACSEADELLFALADSNRLMEEFRSIEFGKILPDAVYVHVDYVSRLGALLRVYEGAARALIGDVGEATLVKLSKVERRISYLWYPKFEAVGHPTLATSLRADLKTCHVKWTDFRSYLNPPILHRKELCVPDDHPSRSKFARLTEKEDRLGLLGDASSIGTLEGWKDVLAEAGLELAGHRLKVTRHL